MKEVVSETARKVVKNGNRTGQATNQPVESTTPFIAPMPRPHTASFESRGATRDQGLSRIAGRVNRTANYGGFGGGMGGGMGYGNTMFTPPQFYRPQLTPTAFNTVTQRKEVYNQVDWWLRNEPLIAAAIMFYSRFPFSGWKLEGCTEYVKDYFERLTIKLDFAKWIPLIAQEYYAMGDCFVHASINCPKCRGKMKDEYNQPCNHEGATWESLYVHDPSTIEVSNAFPGMEPQYYLTPTEEMKRVVLDKNPRTHYDAIPNELKVIIAQGNPIPLHPITITHFKHFSNAYAPFGNSLIRPLFPLLMYKDRLRQAQWLVAERHILPIKIVKLGSEKRYANEDDLQAVQEELAAVANDPFLTLVVPHDFDFEFYGASGKILQISEEFNIIENELINGLMLNKSILSGEGPAYNSASIGLLVMARRLEEFRNIVARYIEEKIFKQEAMWNGFEEEDEGGTTRYVYPKIKFEDLQLKDITGKLQVVIQAVTQGMLPVQTLAEMLDLDWDTQVERLRFEQQINLLQTPGVAQADMGTGFRGPLGMDMSGGMAQQAGLPPLQMAGGGMPPSPMGGMTGMAQHSPWTRIAMEVPESYQIARQLTNNIYTEINLSSNATVEGGGRTVTSMVRTAEESVGMYRQAQKNSTDLFNESMEHPKYKKKAMRIKSAAHAKYLESIRPVNGRGFDKQILPEDEIYFVDFGDYQPYGIPMNRLAIREYCFEDKEFEQDGKRIVVAQRKPQVQLPKEFFTSIEQKLYNLILDAGVPFAFYAQYAAGPEGKYKLDGAFPAIKLAFEADSETFHSHEDQIARDRARDQELMAHGWTIVRFTDKQIRSQEKEVKSVIQSIASKLMGSQNTITL